MLKKVNSLASQYAPFRALILRRRKDNTFFKFLQISALYGILYGIFSAFCLRHFLQERGRADAGAPSVAVLLLAEKMIGLFNHNLCGLAALHFDVDAGGEVLLLYAETVQVVVVSRSIVVSVDAVNRFVEFLNA